MNIYDFAISKEKEAEKHYRSMIEKTEDKGLKSILSRLAEAEVRHRQIVERMKGGNSKPESAEDPILEDAKAVFEKMERSRQVPKVPADQAGLYQHSADMEKESMEFYREKARETQNESHRTVFLALADEEKKHLLLAETLVEMVTRPQTWLENAEWHHMDEY